MKEILFPINLFKNWQINDISAKFNNQDIWIGVYWDTQDFYYMGARNLDLYICLLPMLPIHFKFYQKGILDE